MAEKVETEGRNQDWLKWIAVAALIMAGVYLNSYFSSESLLLRAIGLVIIAGFAGWIASLIVKGRDLIDLCLEARVEIRKVVWPSRQETTQTTIVVLIVIVIVLQHQEIMIFQYIYRTSTFMYQVINIIFISIKSKTFQ